MSRSEKFTIALVVAILLGTAALLVYAVHEDHRWDTSCGSRGGVPFHSHNDRICLDSAVVK